MEKKGIATEKGELNRNIQRQTALSGKSGRRLESSKNGLASCSRRGKPPRSSPRNPPACKSADKVYERSEGKEPEVFAVLQRQHAADELKTIAAAVNYLSEHGISNLDELDASLSSVSDKAYSIREGMKTAEQRMKELQKLMEYGRNYQTYKPYRTSIGKSLERKTGEVCGSPPRRAYPMGRGKPLSPCPFAGGRENPADLRVGRKNIPPSKHSGKRNMKR